MDTTSTHSPLATHAQRQCCCRCLATTDTYATVTITDTTDHGARIAGPTRRFHACAEHVTQLP